MNLNTFNATLPFSSKKYLNTLSSNFLTDIVNSPSRVTSTIATILDHIITNENKLQNHPIVIDYDITDHFSVLANVHCDTVSKGNKPHKFFRSFINFNEKGFINESQLKIETFLPKILEISEKK